MRNLNSTNYSAVTEKPVVFLDSGIGGLPYLAWVREKAPQEDYYYIADRLNFPYGEKSSSQVETLVHELVGKCVEKYDPKIIVIACNSASVSALKSLRERFSLPFVGVVPAIKPAVSLNGSKKIALLATQRTVDDQYTEQLIKDFSHSHQHILRIPAASLVRLVEQDYFRYTRDERLRILGEVLDSRRIDELDALILGCTHFTFLADDLQGLLDQNTRIIDSREGVGNQFLRVLGPLRRIDRKINGTNYFLVTGTESLQETYKLWAKTFCFDEIGFLHD